MKGIFDIIGPIMIGPSSSHTAGAARIGLMAQHILGSTPARVNIKLYGSFAETYRGHGTDKAIIAGLLGFAADDERIPEAMELAVSQHMDFHFEKAAAANVHPNTVTLEMVDAAGHKSSVTGSSVGGGNVVITNINGYPVELTGEYATLITVHEDKPGVIAVVTDILTREHVNVAFMRVSRQERGAEAMMILESDDPISRNAYNKVSAIPIIKMTMLVPPI